MKTYITKHYIFTYKENTLISNDIELIAEEQESCFNKICSVLKVEYPEKIRYYLLDSPEEVGKIYGCDEPINGFAIWGENKIYAVYNETIKCIGPHEDAHLISFIINAPKSYFITEGLAMYFDETWWGVDNDIWSSYYKETNNDLSISKLLNNQEFDNYNCEITYPIAGSFTKYLILTYGIDAYLELYRVKDEPSDNDFKRIFNLTLQEIETSFWQKISKVNYNLETIKPLLDEMNS